jgi:hypothetical protein
LAHGRGVVLAADLQVERHRGAAIGKEFAAGPSHPSRCIIGSRFANT